jgi:hypothetical protein
LFGEESERKMPIVYILIGLAALGFVLYLVNSTDKIDANFKWWINVIVIALVILWALKAFGVWDALLSIRV